MRIIIIICIAFLFNACTAAKAVIAMNKSTEHFMMLEQDNRIFYENGAKKNALNIANRLNNTISTVEKKQYRKFTKPIAIYVCNTVKSFTSYCVIKHASGCVLNERLFLSPKNFQPNQDVLTHELSHLHIEQQLGMYKWHSDYPAWFQEGLATYISQGQGAKKATIEDAKKEIYLGNHFSPNLTGSLLSPKTAYSFGLKTNMFYRQSAMFVQFMHDLDEQKFKILLLSIEDGKNFEQVFLTTYGITLNKIWQQFIKQYHSKI